MLSIDPLCAAALLLVAILALLGRPWWWRRSPRWRPGDELKGNHGTYQDAVEFLLEHPQAPGDETEFLRAWSDGAADEWPEYYEWLADRYATWRTP